MTAYRLLDLFCGAGGAAVGYHRAGFTEIIGVDIAPQPRYPFAFVQADALEYLSALIASGEIARFDMIHASPPCQAYSIAQHIHGNGHEHPDLVAGTRQLLEESGRLYVIENVPGAPLVDPLELCGSMFALPLIRHRLFECYPPVWMAPASHACRRLYTAAADGYSAFANGASAICVAGNNFSRADGARAMGIDWMTRRELSQAIPPAYTEYIGRQMMRVLASHKEAT